MIYFSTLLPLRERTQQLAAETSTETALAELYAQTQAMPESAQKRRLISKLNDANGHGTPGLFSRGGGHVSKTKASGPSEGLKNLLGSAQQSHPSLISICVSVLQIAATVKHSEKCHFNQKCSKWV